jgi:hypothetical protein
MQSESELVWSVVESSPAGEAVVGVYRTLTRARDVVSQLADGRFEDYRIEGHALDQGKETDTPWRVYLGRDGEHLGTTPFAGCSCADDEAEFVRRSFIERDGESMSVIVLAPTPGRAIAAAGRFREWLQQEHLWAPGLQLQPIQAAPAAAPAIV